MKHNTTAKYISKTVFLVLQIVVLIALLRFFVIHPGAVNGISMEPAMRDNQAFIVNKVIYLIRKPKRFEIAQLYDPGNREDPMVKRIIGLPGETIVIKANGTYVRSGGKETKLKEKYLKEGVITRTKSGTGEEWKIPPDSYFVMGDNRLRSADSRNFGPVHRKDIIGKVMQ